MFLTGVCLPPNQFCYVHLVVHYLLTYMEWLHGSLFWSITFCYHILVHDPPATYLLWYHPHSRLHYHHLLPSTIHFHQWGILVKNISNYLNGTWNNMSHIYCCIVLIVVCHILPVLNISALTNTITQTIGVFMPDNIVQLKTYLSQE